MESPGNSPFDQLIFPSHTQIAAQQRLIFRYLQMTFLAMFQITPDHRFELKTTCTPGCLTRLLHLLLFREMFDE